uniref:Ig-like domain-containing protein n=1 Tax=Pygocentrus nattereri TaxID=42514 RepID=A0A3B4C1X0_PYGNA
MSLPQADLQQEASFGAIGVTQSPRLLWVQKGKSGEINCNHDKGNLYFHMYWFRQQQGKPMELIVYTSTTSEPDFGSFDKNKFSATKKVAESGSFTVMNVESDDSALYFCAVSEHSGTVLLLCRTKTPVLMLLQLAGQEDSQHQLM